ncbi:MAG: cytidine deaminase [Actinobacteria bacterium]|nr:cytidine deaminase [Actinomycetota bacterium]
MREEQLSPQLGRLIDAAKSVLAPEPLEGPIEAVALLMDNGQIFTGRSAGDPGSGRCGAAERALLVSRAASGRQIDAVAVAVSPPSDSALPCRGCTDVLAGIDTELPVVLLQLGRWVLLPLSAVPRQP